MKYKQFCLTGLFLILALFGIQAEAFAQSENQSVKEYLEQPRTEEGKGTTDGEQSNLNEQSETSEASNGIGLTLWDFVKMVFATLFVIALLYFVLKLVNKKGAFHQKSNTLVSLGGVSVGNNRSVQLIKVGERVLVVGVGENIQLLTQIEKGDEFDQILTDYNQKLDNLAQPNDIITKLSGLLKGKRKESKAAPTSFQMLLKKQLDEISKDRKEILTELQDKKDRNSHE